MSVFSLDPCSSWFVSLHSKVVCETSDLGSSASAVGRRAGPNPPNATPHRHEGTATNEQDPLPQDRPPRPLGRHPRRPDRQRPDRLPGLLLRLQATTENRGNSWETGSVKLTDDDQGAALFTAKNLKPGQQGEKCITVTSDGTSPALVKLYAANEKATNNLDQYISIKVVQSASCGTAGKTVTDGTLAQFAAGQTGYANGVGDWKTAGTKGEQQAYTITYKFSADAPNSTQSSSAAVDFVWEAQNL